MNWPGWRQLSRQASLELGELEAAGGGEHRTANQPLVFMQPVNRVDSAVHAEVERQRQRAERRPDEPVASEQAGHGRAGARLVRGREREQPDERQARGQHHRRNPHLLGHQKRRQRDPERRRALEQDIVMHGDRHATDLRRDRYRLPRHSAGATSTRRARTPGALVPEVVRPASVRERRAPAGRPRVASA
jgi:hypothetical protein